MAARVTLKAINDALTNAGHTAQLAKGPGYFYFTGGEAADWLDRTVNVETLSSQSMEEWLAEFERLRQLNQKLAGGA